MEPFLLHFHTPKSAQQSYKDSTIWMANILQQVYHNYCKVQIIDDYNFTITELINDNRKLKFSFGQTSGWTEMRGYYWKNNTWVCFGSAYDDSHIFDLFLSHNFIFINSIDVAHENDYRSSFLMCGKTRGGRDVSFSAGGSDLGYLQFIDINSGYHIRPLTFTYPFYKEKVNQDFYCIPLWLATDSSFLEKPGELLLQSDGTPDFIEDIYASSYKSPYGYNQHVLTSEYFLSAVNLNFGSDSQLITSICIKDFEEGYLTEEGK